MRNKQTNTTTAIVYCRISAVDSQSETSDTLLDQERVLTAAATIAGYTDIQIITERHSASKKQPALEHALGLLDSGSAGALFTTKIDRLTRKGAVDVIRIADRASRYSWRLAISDVALDTGTTVGRLVLTILSAVAEMESRRRSDRMREYHAGKKARGEISGATYGSRSTASTQAVKLIAASRSAGCSWKKITDNLNSQHIDGRVWHATAVRRTFASHSVTP